MFWTWSRGKHLWSSSPTWWWIWHSPCQEHWRATAKLLPGQLRGCLGSACGLMNPEMLPLLQHSSPLLHANRAIEQNKVTSHVPRDLSDLHNTQKDSWGFLWSLQKQGEIGYALKQWPSQLQPMHVSYILSAHLRIFELSKTTVPFCCDLSKGFSHFCSKSVDCNWKMSEPNQLSQVNCKLLLGGIPGLFFSWEVWRVSSELFERQIAVVFWINLYLDLHRHIFYRF